MNRSTISEAITATTTPPASASGQGSGPVRPKGRPQKASDQPTIPASMNSVGMVKFRKFRIEMVSVKATATVT